MNFEVTETGPCRRHVSVEVEPELVEEKTKEKVREIKRTRTLPGFRPGRATETIIRRRFGKEIRADVLQELIPEAWSKAMDEHDLEPVSQPDITEVKADPGEPVTIVGDVDVKPQVEIETYKGLSVTRQLRLVADDAVDQRLDRMRKSRADQKSAERPAEMDDIVVATVQGVDVAGLAIVGEREEGRRWELGGQGSVSGTMDEQLVGISVDETRTIVFTYNDDYHDGAKAGKEGRAAVTVTEIIERQLPDLDDEFAKDIGDFETFDDLKQAVRDEMEQVAKSVASRSVHEQLRVAVAEHNRFDVPESLVERQLDGMYEQHLRGQAAQPDPNESPDEEAMAREREVYFGEHRSEATDRVRGMLAIEIIAKQEGFTVEDEAVDERIAQMAASYGIPPAELGSRMVETGRYESMRSDVLAEIVLSFMEEQAEVEEIEADDEDE